MAAWSSSGIRARRRAGHYPYGRLHLKVKETKSAVASVFGRKLLGYGLWVASGGAVKRKVAAKPLLAFKYRIRELTRRSGGRSMKDVVARLRPCVQSWTDPRILRSAGCPSTLLTSTSRTARCGPACRVVCQGYGLMAVPYADLARDAGCAGRLARFS
jgi:hypothetical protein